MGQVKIGVRGHVVKYFPGEQERFLVDIAAPTTVLHLLERLRVDHLLIMMVHINGHKQPKTAIINPGDEVLFFSPPAGG